MSATTDFPITSNFAACPPGSRWALSSTGSSEYLLTYNHSTGEYIMFNLDSGYRAGFPQTNPVEATTGQGFEPAVRYTTPSGVPVPPGMTPAANRWANLPGATIA